jgi:gamma-glutamyltranspeptidase/glutathione hydrolase/leukotriene-C4 hydrolase
LHLPYYTEPEEWEYDNEEEEEEEEEEEDPNSRRGMLTALVAIIIFVSLGALSFGTHFQLSNPEVPIFPPRHYIHSTDYPHTNNRVVLVEAQTGAVATENEICSNMGVETLKQGGNAADAAVSSTLCIGIVNMFSSGIGGGGFLTIRIPPNSTNVSSEVYSIDFREIAPEGSNDTMFKQPFSSMFGGLSVGVPGEIKGLGEMHKRWGKLSWKQVVEPSARLARGWKVGPELDKRMQVRRGLNLFAQFLTW